MSYLYRGKNMEVNGTLINYYFHCQRQCYLHGNRLNLEDESENVILDWINSLQNILQKQKSLMLI